MEISEKNQKHYGRGGLVLLICLALIAGALLIVAIAEVAAAGNNLLIIWSLMAIVIAVTSARHPISFPGAVTSVSVSEALTFLAVIMLGPYHGALLAAVDMLLAGWRLKLKARFYIFNISYIAISVYAAGSAHKALARYIESHQITTGRGQELLELALPLVALALTYYVVQFFLLAIMSYLTHGTKPQDTLRDAFPWEPLTFLAGATVAGLINYAFKTYGLVVMAVTMVLVLPVPIIIYYTFKTYHEKLADQAHHYQELTNIYDSILEMLAMAIDAKDETTHEHIQRVKLFARRVGQLVGLSELEIEALKAGALLHDIGKIGVPAYILNKPGKLTEHEFEQMKLHTVIGADMLSNVAFRYPVVPIVRHHHERWDGRGYPDGLKGEEIPITARILTLVDTYDALRSDRPYHKAMSREDTLEYIKANAGTFYDPRLVEIFLSVVDQLEAEAAAFRASQSEKHPAQNSAMANNSAKPAAGLAAAPKKIDRATAALNSIAETNQRVTALYEMSRTLASILSVEDTVAILVNRLSKLIPFTTCAISLFDASRSEFEIVHAAGHHAETLLKRRQPAEAGITGWVITNQRAMYNTNPVLDLGFLGPDLANEYKTAMVFPLIKNQDSLGAIALYSTELDSYGSEHIQLMESISQPASDSVYNALTFEQAQRAALVDPVTGLSNMRALTNQYEREQARSQRLGLPLSLAIFKFDNLDEVAAKSKTGYEQTLAQIGKLISQQVRETDLMAFQGVNTFVALLPDSGQVEASEVRSRIRRLLNSTNLSASMLVSTGSATSPGDGNTFKELLNAAQIDCNANRESFEMVSANLNDIIHTEAR